MLTLVEFLTARLDEDEAVAKRAAQFRYDHPQDAPWERARLAVEHDAAFSSDPHIARHDPARVLAEVDAKRRIVELHSEEHECVGDRHGQAGTVLVAPGYQHELCPTLLLLALPYADHPDYDEAWRP